MRLARMATVLLAALALLAPAGPLEAAPVGQLTWGVHIALARAYFDPAETPGLITPFMVLYALHDAVAKPMPSEVHIADSITGPLAEELKRSQGLALKPTSITTSTRSRGSRTRPRTKTSRFGRSKRGRRV